MEHELWLTALLNRYLAGPADAVLNAVQVRPENSAHPVSNWFSMELLVVAILIVLVATLRPRLSMDTPGKLQHVFEVIYEFVEGQAHDSVGHGSGKYVSYFGTLFIFI